MHFIEDTEDEDFETEVFWKEDFKKILREKVPERLCNVFTENKNFFGIYEKQYLKQFKKYGRFVNAIANMTEIGCENGSDDAFNEIYISFRLQSRLPKVKRYARFFWPTVMTPEISKLVHEAIIDEYGNESSYQADYDAHYSQWYSTFDFFLNQIAQYAISSMEMGADDMLGQIYRAFVLKLPLPIPRRRPRRLKGW